MALSGLHRRARDSAWPAALHVGTHCLMDDIRKVPSFPLRDRLVAMGIITVLLLSGFLIFVLLLPHQLGQPICSIRH